MVLLQLLLYYYCNLLHYLYIFTTNFFSYSTTTFVCHVPFFCPEALTMVSCHYWQWTILFAVVFPLCICSWFFFRPKQTIYYCHKSIIPQSLLPAVKLELTTIISSCDWCWCWKCPHWVASSSTDRTPTVSLHVPPVNGEVHVLSTQAEPLLPQEDSFPPKCLSTH